MAVIFGDAAQRLKSIDDGFEMRGRRLNGAVNGAFEPFDSLALMIDFHDVIQQRDVLFRVGHLQLAHPLPPGCRPGSAAFGSSLPVAEEVFAQTVPGSHLVLLGSFAGADQIAQRFMVSVGDPDRAEITTSVGTRQLLGVAAVRLDSITGHLGDERWCDHIAVNAEASQLPVQDVSGREAGFVADPKASRVPELADELADRIRAVGNHPQRASGVSPLHNRDRDGLRVYIHANISCCFSP